LIPYDRFSIRIDKHEWLRHPEEQLENLNKISVKDGLELYNEMLKYVKYINWRQGNGVLEAILAKMTQPIEQ